VQHPVVWAKDATGKYVVTDLGTFGGHNGMAVGIYSQGEIVGTAEDTTAAWYGFPIRPLTRLSDLYATADSLWSILSMHSGEGVSVPDSPKTSCSHICNRSAPSMSVNVGVTFALYQGRSLSTCEPS